MKYDPHGYVVTQDQEDNAGETGLHGLTRTSDSEAGVWGGVTMKLKVAYIFQTCSYTRLLVILVIIIERRCEQFFCFGVIAKQVLSKTTQITCSVNVPFLSPLPFLLLFSSHLYNYKEGD